MKIIYRHLKPRTTIMIPQTKIQIQRNCENIEINDIPDVTTDYNVSSIKEEIYDNVDLATENKSK